MYSPLEVFGGAIGTGLKNVTYPLTSVVLNDLEEYVFCNISVKAYTWMRLGSYSSHVMERKGDDGNVII